MIKGVEYEDGQAEQCEVHALPSHGLGGHDEVATIRSRYTWSEICILMNRTFYQPLTVTERRARNRGAPLRTVCRPNKLN